MRRGPFLPGPLRHMQPEPPAGRLQATAQACDAASWSQERPALLPSQPRVWIWDLVCTFYVNMSIFVRKMIVCF